MTIIKNNFSPSVNIIRDFSSQITYIPTANAKIVFQQLAVAFDGKTRAFTIVGSYGTGKSSFLWAFINTINRKSSFFDIPEGKVSQYSEYKVVPIVGTYSSLVKSCANHYGVESNTTEELVFAVLERIREEQEESQKLNKGYVLVIDEFGKFLEYAAKNNPEQELYFIQQLAEYVNSENKNTLLITTLHQDFNAYAWHLPETQRKEWDKIKGRLKELTFNEPVEQLLLLAAERINNIERITQDQSNFDSLFSIIETSKVFPLRSYLDRRIAQKLIPFDILSAAILTQALQKYGQNERSLFSFIESEDYLGLRDYDLISNPYYNISCVYDYLIYNFYSFLSTNYNPDYGNWVAIRIALERAEALEELNELSSAYKLIKTIGLLNIFGGAGAIIDEDFLSNYAAYSLGIKEVGKVVKILENHKIVRYRNFSKKFVLFEGTDIDINAELRDAEEKLDRVNSIMAYLNKDYFDLPYIPAKTIYYEKGTPRFFEFRLTEKAISDKPTGEIDGFINLIFTDSTNQKDVQCTSAECKEAILYGFFKNTDQIKDLIFEIEKAKKVLELHQHDKVVIRELENLIKEQKQKLSQHIIGNLYTRNENVIWFREGKEVIIDSRKSFNRQLSDICKNAYSKVPHFRSELVNRTKLSGAISTARKNLIRALINNSEKADLGFNENKFPPEKSIYLSLLKRSGIHSLGTLGYELNPPENESYQALWRRCLKFIDDSKEGPRKITELIDILLDRPFKLKQGFIDFWIPIFLFIKRDDYALYNKEGAFVPYISDDTLELIVKNPDDYTIKGFSVEGVKLDLFNKYRSFLQQSQRSILSNQGFIETIKPFMVFHRGLPTYSKNTKRLSKQAIALREAITKAVDPEKTFFEDFPRALNYSFSILQESSIDLENYTQLLQNTIREIRNSYDALIDRIESFILSEFFNKSFSFPEYKAALQKRFSKLQHFKLSEDHKTFYMRLSSGLDDRKAWLNSLAQAVVGKSLDSITDTEEDIFYERFRTIIQDLDNFSELSQEDINEEQEEVLKLKISSFLVNGLEKIIRIPKKKNKEVVKLETKIKDVLNGQDKRVNVAVLAKILQEYLKDEKS